MILLTKLNGEPVLINTTIINLVERNDDKGSYIRIKGMGQYGDIQVKETVEEILAKLG